MSDPVLLVERLVTAVARAFYTDSFVVVIDAILREKYILEEELGPRLKLPAKEIRHVVTVLEEYEMLLKKEVVTYEDKGPFTCFYIDYQSFVNVVRFRIHCMEQAVSSQEISERTDIFYKCPTCKDEYSVLDAQHYLSKDYKFICPNCFDGENFRESISEPRYRLMEVDNRGKLNNVQLLDKKLNEQLNKNNLHDGIYDLLYSLRDVNVGHNKPSENIKKGYRPSIVIETEVLEEIDYNKNVNTVQKVEEIIEDKDFIPNKKARIATKTGSELLSLPKVEIDVEINDHDFHDVNQQYQIKLVDLKQSQLSQIENIKSENNVKTSASNSSSSGGNTTTTIEKMNGQQDEKVETHGEDDEDDVVWET